MQGWQSHSDNVYLDCTLRVVFRVQLRWGLSEDRPRERERERDVVMVSREGGSRVHLR
jgi:hypothetical protein